jgi:hypothetical protein
MRLVSQLLALDQFNRDQAMASISQQSPETAARVQSLLRAAQSQLHKIQPEQPAQPDQPVHEEPAQYEYVNHPKHYNAHPSGVECIDIIEHMSFNLGTAVKYCWRQGLKPEQASIQDLRKAIWYINREIELIERQQS